MSNRRANSSTFSCPGAQGAGGTYPISRRTRIGWLAALVPNIVTVPPGWLEQRCQHADRDRLPFQYVVVYPFSIGYSLG